ncbi:ABC-F family ATP-binding cassette domain-containing protein [Faecousia sp.]|jgi:ATPase subunit of ABC transporter with duplicated ATPase domains|uniref:ABC-F family ATP-binding cassette domain-containing protein n=1 Tax=Faecousia sp. TaxID=2952921 RepID=UPI000ED4898B|nr:ATP-binding cassette domain-containing protein [Bacillota bacterium]MDY5341948.1 ATP-binding cassette domain-containing protein [Candidatus Faecousia sp.]MEE0787175.1 ATP-binding cassette domain-containing protein [Oscillospiraceae bacterium]HCS34022.1 ABC transporter ATP-binding protein [Clostridiales bacterium]
MITISDLALQYSGTFLFQHVDLQFTAGNCYGVIGANGAGKSTFLKLLSGELDSTKGTISIKPGLRMSVLKQDQFRYDAYTILDTVIMGNQRLYDIMKQKDALYAKPDFSDEDGLLASELETEFAELNGWEAESDASRILQGLGVPVELHNDRMADTDGRIKVKVLLAQALFGQPDIILLDEPTNNLDIESINWLENFILDYEDNGLVIVVSHDRHFLNTVCTHIVDIDYGKIRMYVGNYDFWYESSQLMQNLIRSKNKRNEEKIAELQAFISRFSANKAKSKQATARRRLLDKLSVEEMPASSRRYPFVGFTQEREVGKDILFVTDVSKTVDGVKLLDKVSFIVNRGDKIAFVGENEVAQTTMFKILMGELEPDEGTVKWGVSTSQSYFPKDNSEYFDGHDETLVDWLRQFSEKKDDVYLRGFLGRMLFSGEDVFKSVKVLSGGEKVRCMLSRMMLSGANVILLDQPTNHLDMESIQAVNKGLIAFPGNILLASHDHEMLQSVANRIIEFRPDGTICDRLGTYDEYLEYQAALKNS